MPAWPMIGHSASSILRQVAIARSAVCAQSIASPGCAAMDSEMDSVAGAGHRVPVAAAVANIPDVSGHSGLMLYRLTARAKVRDDPVLQCEVLPLVAVPDVILTEKCLAVFRAAKLSDHLRALRLGGIVAKEILPASKQASMAALGRRFVVSEILPTCAWSSFLQASSAAREEPESPSTDPQPKQARDLPVARASEIPTGAEPFPQRHYPSSKPILCDDPVLSG